MAVEAGPTRRGRPGGDLQQADPDRVRTLFDARQELQSQLDALAAAQCKLIFSEKISTRVKTRPELEKALKLAYDIKEAAPGQEVILTVLGLKRLARNAAELMTLSGQLQGAGVQLELLTGPLTGIYDPNGMGAMFFAVLVAAAQTERIYIREKTLEGQVTAAAEGNRGGRPKVIDDDSLLFFACALKDKGVPVPEIAKKLTIKTGKNAGKSPSVASLYRALAEADERDARRRRRSSDRAAPYAPGSPGLAAAPPELMERLKRQSPAHEI